MVPKRPGVVTGEPPLDGLQSSRGGLPTRPLATASFSAWGTFFPGPAKARMVVRHLGRRATVRAGWLASYESGD